MATTILLYPELKKNITEVVVNFGRRLESEVEVTKKNLIMPDTNVDGDIEAVGTLILNKIPLTLIPTELMFDQLITSSRMQSLEIHPLKLTTSEMTLNFKSK